MLKVKLIWVILIFNRLKIHWHFWFTFHTERLPIYVLQLLRVSTQGLDTREQDRRSEALPVINFECQMSFSKQWASFSFLLCICAWICLILALCTYCLPWICERSQSLTLFYYFSFSQQDLLLTLMNFDKYWVLYCLNLIFKIPVLHMAHAVNLYCRHVLLYFIVSFLWGKHLGLCLAKCASKWFIQRNVGEINERLWELN